MSNIEIPTSDYGDMGPDGHTIRFTTGIGPVVILALIYIGFVIMVWFIMHQPFPCGPHTVSVEMVTK